MRTPKTQQHEAGQEKPLQAEPLIVIGRQFGSGGRRIGKLVAEKLGCPYYDKELLSKTAESLGYAREIFAAHDEKKPSPLRTLLQGVYGIADNFHDTSICAERLYREQSEVIRQIANSRGCVIVGRTADYVMRDHPALVSVFLHAPLQFRAKAIVSRGESCSEAQAAETARRRDHDRESYYNYYTGSSNWGKASNYHLSVDASLMCDSDVADLIVEFATRKLKTMRE